MRVSRIRHAYVAAEAPARFQDFLSRLALPRRPGELGTAPDHAPDGSERLSLRIGAPRRWAKVAASLAASTSLHASWHRSCCGSLQQEGAHGAPPARRPVEQCDADCLTYTPSHPLPLTLKSDGPAAARHSNMIPELGRASFRSPLQECRVWRGA